MSRQGTRRAELSTAGAGRCFVPSNCGDEAAHSNFVIGFAGLQPSSARHFLALERKGVDASS